LERDITGYLLEEMCIAEQVRGILLSNGLEMLNNHFVDDYLIFISVDQGFANVALSCLDTFCATLGIMVSAHKIDYWLIGMDSPPEWILASWSHIRPGVIVRYLGIPFEFGLSSVAMWDWCL